MVLWIIRRAARNRNGLGACCCGPWSRQAVIEFRPDFAVALVTAMGVVMTVTRSLTKSSWHYRCAVGGVFAAAFLIKPTMFVMTFGLWGLSLSVGLAADWYLNRPA